MTRRIGLAIVGMVIAALLLAGLGTVVLASVTAREASEDDLREQVETLRSLLGELTITPGNDTDETILERLDRVTRSLSVEGIGLLIYPQRVDTPIGALPDGLEIDDLDGDALRAGETISGRKGDLVWAATAGRNSQGVGQVLVLTDTRPGIIAPAFGWFVLSALVTIALALLVTLRLSRSLTRPIRRVSATTSRLADGDLAARVSDDDVRPDGEIGELVRSVNAMADGLDRARHRERDFLLSVSHDLRTPLTSIRGYAEALRDGAVDDPVAAGTVIETEARRLERLVGDILLLARVESTGFAYDVRRHPASEIAEEAALAFGPDARDRSLGLQVELPPGEASDTDVFVDADRCGQIVANLLGNAVRYARTTVLLSVRTTPATVEIRVADDGPGIPEADLPHVFERLYVGSAGPDSRESGSGLGLAIVRELAQGMDGTVVARRSGLGGAEFVVSFPRAR